MQEVGTEEGEWGKKRKRVSVCVSGGMEAATVVGQIGKGGWKGREEEWARNVN